jgi:hypothetical protein
MHTLRTTRFGKLSSLAALPRPLSPVLERITDKPFFFLPWAVSSWKQRMQNAPLVAAAVVQANRALHSPETACFSPAVLCFTLGPRALAEDAVRHLASVLGAIRDGHAIDPSGGRIAARLRDESSSFYEALPPALGAAAFWATHWVDPDRLPNRYLPSDGVLPALVHPPDEYVELVPASLWA